MKAREITEAGKEALRSGRFQVVRVNYANPGARPGPDRLPCGRARVPVALLLALAQRMAAAQRACMSVCPSWQDAWKSTPEL